MTAFDSSLPSGSANPLAEAARTQLTRDFASQSERRSTQPMAVAEVQTRHAETIEIQISRRQMEFRSLIHAVNQDPASLAKNETRLDRILHSADRDTDAALKRMQSELKHTGGDAAFIEKRASENDLVRRLLATAEYSKYSLLAEQYMTYRDYGHEPKAEVVEALRAEPGVLEACDRVRAARKNPALHLAEDIAEHAWEKMRDSFELRDQYARALSQNGRSGKALAMIVQRKELKRQFDDLTG
jgi:hypothetical protein